MTLTEYQAVDPWLYAGEKAYAEAEGRGLKPLANYLFSDIETDRHAGGEFERDLYSKIKEGLEIDGKIVKAFVQVPTQEITIVPNLGIPDWEVPAWKLFVRLYQPLVDAK